MSQLNRSNNTDVPTSSITPPTPKHLVRNPDETFPPENIRTGKMRANLDVVEGDLKSGNFLRGVQGWIVEFSGDSEFNQITVRGTIISNSGNIAGFDISNNTISKNNLILNSNGRIELGSGNDIIVLSAVDATYRLWVGDSSPGSAPTSLTKSGKFTTTSAEIASFTINNSQITKNDIVIDSTGQIRVGSGNDIIVLSSVNSTYRLWAGNSSAGSAVTQLEKSGKFITTNGVFTGDITAKSGDFAGPVTFGGNSNVKIEGNNERILINDGTNDRVIIGNI